MSEDSALLERVSDLEKEVKILKQAVFKDASKPGWVSKVIGSMENDSDFAEILKLGREIRNAERE